MFLLAFNFYNFVMTLDCVIKSAVKKNNLTEFFSSVLGFSLVKSVLQQEKLMPFDLVVFYREHSFCKYCWPSSVKFEDFSDSGLYFASWKCFFLFLWSLWILGSQVVFSLLKSLLFSYTNSGCTCSSLMCCSCGKSRLCERVSLVKLNVWF